MRAPAAASGVPTRRHAPFAISSQARRRLGKELKPASRRASNACQRIESTRHVNESTFSEAWNPTYPCYKVHQASVLVWLPASPPPCAVRAPGVCLCYVLCWVWCSSPVMGSKLGPGWGYYHYPI
jgi:hypothetical protein